MKTGSNTSGIESSAARKRRRAKQRREEERRWAEKSGPVTVKFVDPATLRTDR